MKTHKILFILLHFIQFQKYEEEEEDKKNWIFSIVLPTLFLFSTVNWVRTDIYWNVHLYQRGHSAYCICFSIVIHESFLMIFYRNFETTSNDFHPSLSLTLTFSTFLRVFAGFFFSAQKKGIKIIKINELRTIFFVLWQFNVVRWISLMFWFIMFRRWMFFKFSVNPIGIYLILIKSQCPSVYFCSKCGFE